MLQHSATCSKAMSNIVEQIAAGVLVFGSIGAYLAAIIGFVALCHRIIGWLCGVPRVPPVSIKPLIGKWSPHNR